MNLNIKIILLIVPLFLSCFLFSQDNKSKKYLVEGNKKYLGLSYDEAAANYLRAIQESEYSYKSNFNLGNAMYRLKKYDDAISQYEKSSKFAANKFEESDAHFNIGDCFYKKKEYAKSAEAFKKTLKLNPKDGKARYNYALAKQKEKEEKEKKDSQNQKNQKQENKQNSEEKEKQNQPQDSQPLSQNNKEKNQQGQSGGQGDEKSGQGNGKEKGQQIERDNTTYGDEAPLKSGQGQYYEGILGAMKEQEKRAQQKIINKRKPPTQDQGGKDW